MLHEVFVYLATFSVGLVSAVYGVAVGGGALLTVPALVFLGLPVVEAVGTSRMGSLGVVSTGLVTFGKAKSIDWPLSFKMTFLQIGGTVIGAYMLVSLPVYWVKQGVAFTILGVLCLFIFFPSAGLEPGKVPKGSFRYRMGYVVLVCLGILAGFYQGGAGTLAAYCMILFFGQTFLESAGTRKFPFLITNLITLAILLPKGKVYLGVGTALGLGTALGGYIGAKMAIDRGNKWVRRLFIIVVSFSGIRMLVDSLQG